MRINNFAKKRSGLFWDIKDFDALNEEAIVERILNYGDWEDVKKIISILGMKKTSEIFRKQIKRQRNSYRPEVKNYFKLYFDKYA